MRIENSIKNIIVALICNVITIIVGFIAQSIFVKTLGMEYSGLNGVFLNIISMLSIAELGIGSAIIYNLYKPIAENNIPKIRQLLNFYKKSYNIIALVILIIGICIIPFINIIIGENNITENIYIVYFIFLADSVVSYLVAYKRTIIYANQKNRIVDIVHLLYTLAMNAMQIVILLLSKNYILYLMIKVICRIIENLVINLIANKMYHELVKKSDEKLDAETLNDIIKKVKALIMHQIGGYIVLGTDSIIISNFFGLSTVGIYVNYNLIIAAANILLSQFFSSVTASVGNLLVENDPKKSFSVYKKIMFFNFWIYGLASIGMFFAIDMFIELWIGGQYIFAQAIVFTLSLNFYAQGMRRTMQTFALAGGICHENRFIPLVEAIVNLVASIILAKLLGVIGVFLGTILSTLVLYCYSFPKFIYYPLFNEKGTKFILENIKYLIILAISFGINLLIIKNISLDFFNIPMKLLFNIIVSLITVNIIFFIVFRKSNEFIYFKEMLLSKISQRKRRDKRYE